MVPLYFVITMFGLTAGTVGPLPYDKDECEVRAQEYRDAWNTKWQNGTHKKEVGGRVVGKDDLKFTCEYHAVRPKNDRRLGP